jgi:ABC-type multidrug transport system fused ATPase/permease subunit
MLEPSAGAVLIDGVDTRHVSLRSLRRRISVVPQDTSLFDGTIQYNIDYGNFSATAADFNAAVGRCNLAPVIARLENGFQTEVGERGARLSGGERQKVSIARALLKDPSLILCDEVTSSVDALAERELVTSLVLAGRDKTMVTIAHRLSR